MDELNNNGAGCTMGRPEEWDWGLILMKNICLDNPVWNNVEYKNNVNVFN